MSDLEILKQNKPDIAELIERWRERYERSFDLKDPAEQSTFFEGLTEMGRHMAVASETGKVKLSVSNEGVAALTVNVI